MLLAHSVLDCGIVDMSRKITKCAGNQVERQPYY